MSPLHTALLLATVLTTGLMAGLFFAYSFSVMPGLALSSDRVLVETMQNINRAIINPVFMLPFVGSIPLLIAVVIMSVDDPALPWLIAALILYVVSFLVTMAANVPLNNRLDQAGDPEHIPDLAAVRRGFEPRWVTFNLVRTSGHTAAFACAAWALTFA
ncbi:anthrone oxygenase family protein [Sphaerisporangium aureirubrum]|uniref:DUF1772 domain-containing protein n=1 Tax=Sphaerisporangium aureirubrum TaxID=1544736 RepID=A0ABW1NMD6_9ACTN